MNQKVNPATSGTFLQELHEWAGLQAELERIKLKEKELRKKIFCEAFPIPVEGTDNKLSLSAGYVLQGTFRLRRAIDMGQVMPMRDELAKIGVPIEPLLNWSVKLNKTNYAILSPEARSLFDNIITTTEGSPRLQILAPGQEMAQEQTVTVEVPQEEEPKKKRRKRKPKEEEDAEKKPRKKRTRKSK